MVAFGRQLTCSKKEMLKIVFKFLWLFLASTVPLILAGCSGTGIARTSTENTT